VALMFFFFSSRRRHTRSDRDWSSDVCSSDLERLRLRPIRPDDESRLSELYDRSSRDTRYQRFFTVMRRLPADWARFLANVDYDRSEERRVGKECRSGVGAEHEKKKRRNGSVR